MVGRREDVGQTVLDLAVHRWVQLAHNFAVASFDSFHVYFGPTFDETIA